MTKAELKDIIEDALFQYWRDNCAAASSYKFWYYGEMEDFVHEILELVDI